MNKLIAAIERLEDKRDNGTITMNEEALMCGLIQRAEEILYNKKFEKKSILYIA